MNDFLVSMVAQAAITATNETMWHETVAAPSHEFHTRFPSARRNIDFQRCVSFEPREIERRVFIFVTVRALPSSHARIIGCYYYDKHCNNNLVHLAFTFSRNNYIVSKPSKQYFILLEKLTLLFLTLARITSCVGFGR